MEELEDESDLLSAKLREAVLVERGDVGAVDDDLAAVFSIGSSTGHTVSAISRAPSAFGCTPSAWLRSALPATRSSRNGTKATW